MTKDLVAFIEARLAEDQAAAEAIDVPDWRAESSWMSELIEPLPSQKRLYDGQFPLITAEDVAHIARHDPARVLRDVAAKRRTLGRHQRLPDPRVGYDLPSICGLCDSEWPCPEVLDLAAPYADHPDYHTEWSPS